MKGERKNVPNCTVKRSRSKTKALTDILQEQVAFYFTFQSDLSQMTVNEYLNNSEGRESIYLTCWGKYPRQSTCTLLHQEFPQKVLIHSLYLTRMPAHQAVTLTVPELYGSFPPGFVVSVNCSNEGQISVFALNCEKVSVLFGVFFRFAITIVLENINMSLFKAKRLTISGGAISSGRDMIFFND